MRRLLTLTILCALTAAGTASAAWTAAPMPGGAALSHDGGNSEVTISVAGPYLQHGLSSAGEAGFVSNLDWNTAVDGEQTLPADGSRDVTVNGNGGNDVITLLAGGSILHATLSGGDGDDTLTGGPDSDTLDGGAGHDTLTGNQGADVVFGGADSDVVSYRNGDGSDTIDGGAGTDALEATGARTGEQYSIGTGNGQTQIARLAPGAFTLLATGLERVALSMLSGDDAISVSGDVPQLDLHGGAGNDSLQGGSRGDLLDGGDGDDALQVRDGGADLARCGAGADTAVVDSADALADCETVDLPPAAPPPPAADATGLAPTLAVGARIRRGRVSLTLTCPAAEAGGCRGQVTLATANRVRVGGLRAVVVLGTARFTLAAGQRRTVSVTLATGYRRLLRRGRLAVRATAISLDAAGNRSEAARRATIRR